MATHRQIIWTLNTYQQLEKIYMYILEQSFQNAEKVRWEIVDRIERAAIYPEIGPLEIYKKNNSGNCRYFEKHHIRVTYIYTEDEIFLVRIRHTSMKPSYF